MKIKCDYCGQMIDEGLDRCPNCGASIQVSIVWQVVSQRQSKS